MALTFKSSSQETKVVIDREPSGRQRIGRAVQSEHNDQLWRLEVEHPNGKRWPGTFHGSGEEAIVALAEMMSRTKNEYIQDRARGDQPPPETRDRNVPVDDLGQNIAAPIKPRW